MTPYGLYVVSTYLSGGTLAHGITYERVCYLYMCIYLKKGVTYSYMAIIMIHDC